MAEESKILLKQFCDLQRHGMRIRTMRKELLEESLRRADFYMANYSEAMYMMQNNGAHSRMWPTKSDSDEQEWKAEYLAYDVKKLDDYIYALKCIIDEINDEIKQIDAANAECERKLQKDS